MQDQAVREHPPSPHDSTVPVHRADDSSIAEAAAIIRAGQLVAFATETVYGLGADATNDQAVARIFEAKGRPRFNPLIVHVPDIDHAKRYGQFSAVAEALAKAFWPGPFTLVVERTRDSGIGDLVSAGMSSIALRVPAHPQARQLLNTAECPIAAPSANRSGHVSATEAAHVAADFKGRDVALVLDCGPTQHGIESTIVDARGENVVLLRSGSITRQQIEAVIGGNVIDAQHGVDVQPHAPGRLESHYAPAAQLRINATLFEAEEAVLAFGDVKIPDDHAQRNLSPSGDLVEAAANLFKALRELDATGAARIAVTPVPETGLGEAINDRLRRAAAPRP